MSDRSGAAAGGMENDGAVSCFANPDRAIDPAPPYRRIAVEEAWSIPEIPAAQLDLLHSACPPDDASLRMGAMFAGLPALQAQLCDIGPGRIARMDALGIDHQLLLLTAPGVQVLERGIATHLAALSNDRLAEACRAHPDRFSGLLAFAPQDVPAAVREIERGMRDLKLAGAVVNSHTQGRYLDEPQFLPVLEALEAHDAALYIHPTTPPTQWVAPYAERAFTGALAGFTHEVWMHVMGLIFSGAFDRFPRLRLVIGHMGEALPLLLYRFDWMQSNADGRPGLRGGQPAVKLKHKVSHYFRNNIWITTSGVAWEPAIRFCQDVLGPERMLYAMDYPYQVSAAEVAAHDHLAIPAEHKKMLMQTNAEQVFRLYGGRRAD
ncbi:amidohydrolase family protein [Sphingomonas baiyangensis]|uniref:Amidohydrolase n=1 Tax=Sphingomonas baiyangensis TaxID=2572576 RepID=A0A4V5PW08_9SPHN|nr:amidohydrolase family protein [Sphingomonas baiyangensis]TKD49878.1 amidohydrolase [Sphingomonas baiyangensis]